MCMYMYGVGIPGISTCIHVSSISGHAPKRFNKWTKLYTIRNVHILPLMHIFSHVDTLYTYTCTCIDCCVASYRAHACQYSIFVLAVFMCIHACRSTVEFAQRPRPWMTLSIDWRVCSLAVSHQLPLHEGGRPHNLRQSTGERQNKTHL